MGLAYYSLFAEKSPSDLQPAKSEETTDAKADILAALAQESEKTSGKYWRGSEGDPKSP